MYELNGVTILPTGCGDCFIRLGHSERDDDFAWVDVGLLSGHLPVEHWRWFGFNGRLRSAFRALRGLPPPTFEFYSKDELSDFITALDEASRAAFA